MEQGRSLNYISYSLYSKVGTRGTTQSNPYVYHLAARAESIFFKIYCKDNMYSMFDEK